MGTKSPFKVKPGRRRPKLVAPKPCLGGKPGERLAKCVGAEIRSRGSKRQAILTFETTDGEVGTMWCDVTNVTARSRYITLVRRALGANPPAGYSIEPQEVFVGKFFAIFVGYRKTPGVKGRGGKAHERLASEGPKDEKDFLRVHNLLARISEAEFCANDATDLDPEKLDDELRAESAERT